MARTPFLIAGPELNHMLSYSTGTGGTFDMVSTPTPPQGTYWFHATGTVASSRILSPEQAGTLTYRWYSLRAFRLSGTLNVGQIVRFLRFGGTGRFLLRWIYDTASTFKVELFDTVAVAVLDTSVASYSTDTDVSIRCQIDGTNLLVWINGVLELEYATTVRPNLNVTLENNVLAASQDMYWRGVYCSESNAESERPGTTVFVEEMIPNGNTADTDYGNQADCANTANGDFGNWDDYSAGGTPNDGTDFNCGPAADRKEISSLTSVTLPSGLVVEGVEFRLWRRANLTSKTVDNWAVLQRAGTETEKKLTNPGTSWEVNAIIFATEPGGGAWTQANVDALEAGSRVVSTNGANLECSALALELGAVNDDPLAATATGKTVGKKPLVFASANPMVL